MKRIFHSALWLCALAFVACDDSTSKIGYDVMPKSDGMTALDAEYNVESRTIKADSVYAGTNTCYLGSIKDPEMNIRTTSGFLAQFNTPSTVPFPKQEKIVKDNDGHITADSCDIRIYLDSFYGDSLTTMKLRVQELSKEHVLEEDSAYYTNIDVDKYINKNGVDKSLTYTVKDLTRPDNETTGKSYYRQIIVRLPKEYGTKIMDAYYSHPEYFDKTYSFIRKVCPGFSFKSAGGTGVMVKTAMMAMNVYFRYHSKTAEGNDTIMDGMQSFGGTEEVLQTTHIDNTLPGSLSEADLAEKPCTYIKSPAAFYTELTLPINDLENGKQADGSLNIGEHYNDSINLAKIVIRHKENSSTGTVASTMPTPTYLLMVRKSDMNSFFVKGSLPDSKLTYLSSASSIGSNYYSYSNIAPLISRLRAERNKGAFADGTDPKKVSPKERKERFEAWEREHPEWNKVVLVPVDVVYTKSSTSTVLQSVSTLLGLSTVQLEGGKDSPLQLQVVYSRFSK